MMSVRPARPPCRGPGLDGGHSLGPVKPPAFTYHRPRSLEEALDTLASLGAEGKVLAGGQSLVPLMSMRLAAPAHLVDVNHVPGLDTVEVDEAAVRVGALARHSRVEHDRAAYDAAPLLRQALRHVAHPTIRNRGTTVGSLVHADPAAEMSAVLRLLDGSVTLRGAEGTREVAAATSSPARWSPRCGPASWPSRRPSAGRRRAAAARSSRWPGGTATTRCAGSAPWSPCRGRPASPPRVALICVGDGPVLVDLTDPPAARRVDGPRTWSTRAIDPEADIHASADYRRHLAHVLAAARAGRRRPRAGRAA